jgi:spermidine synthase
MNLLQYIKGITSDKINLLPDKENFIEYQHFSFNQQSVLTMLFVLGFCAIPGQTVIFRELILACGGNELIIGIILANWMLVNATGVYAGRYVKVAEQKLYIFTIVIAWVPVLLLFLIDFLRNKLFMPGIQLNLFQIFLASLVLFLPFCFLSGLLFTWLTGVLRNTLKKYAGERAYGSESIGSFAGGILFSFILTYFNDNYRAAYAIALVSNMILITCFIRKIKPVLLISFMVFFMLPVTLTVFINGNMFSRQLLFSNQKLLTSEDTPYGNLAVASTSGQLNFYENNVLLFATNNELFSEEAVHFAMIQHPSPESVLLISGGLAGLTEEILKYSSVKQIDYMEIDPAVIDLGRKYTSFLDDQRIRIIQGDARLNLRRIRNKYDVAIISLPEPSSIQLNRYYTAEFLGQIRKNLSDSGVLTLSLPPTFNYMNEGAVIMNSSLFNTCKELFRYVKIFPGEKNYFVASNARLNININQQIEIKGIENDYVNSYYIDDHLLALRVNTLLDQLNNNEIQNSDFKPVAFYGFLQYWLRQFGFRSNNERWIFIVVVLFIILVFTLSPAMSGMFVAGFSSSALQITVLLSFQIVYGYVYQSLGAFTAIFMAGLWLGARLRPRIMSKPTQSQFAFLPGILALISLLIPSIIVVSDKLALWPIVVHSIFFFIMLLVSSITGFIFSSAVQIRNPGKAGTAAAVYSIDLAGATLGSVLVILLLIPLFGILHTPFIIGLLNLLVAVNMLLRKH